MLRISDDSICAAAGLLVKCFTDDPLVNIQMKNIRDKDTLLLQMMKVQVHTCLKTMDVITDETETESLLIGYEKRRANILKEILWGILFSARYLKDIDKGDRREFGKNSRMVPKVTNLSWQNEFIPGNYYRIKIIAIEPTKRGIGIFRRLVSPILEINDKRGLATILETNIEKNIPIYEHYGFQLVKEFAFAESIKQFCFVKK